MMAALNGQTNAVGQCTFFDMQLHRRPWISKPLTNNHLHSWRYRGVGEQRESGPNAAGPTQEHSVTSGLQQGDNHSHSRSL